MNVTLYNFGNSSRKEGILTLNSGAGIEIKWKLK